MISVRFATPSDQDRLVDFIGAHWSSTHIFTQRPDVFAWQHEQSDGRLNMVFAEESREAPDADVLGQAAPEPPIVLAVLGFIPMGRFDAELGDRDLMLAIWKVRETGVPPGVGLRLLKFLRRELDPRMIAAIGTSQIVRPIYEVLGYTVGALRQAALFNPDPARTLTVSSGFPAGGAQRDRSTPQSASVSLVALDHAASNEMVSAIDRIGGAGIPSKSWVYITERYLRHPWYRYEVCLVEVDREAEAVVVWRRVEVGNTSVLRIVDVIGPTGWFRNARPAFERVVADAAAEYIDLVHLGVDLDDLRKGGFVEASEHPGSVLPNYFSPFEQRNVEIELAYKVLAPDEADVPVRLFRADSDQDRPNNMSELNSPRR
jgi:hypothetical protein